MWVGSGKNQQLMPRMHGRVQLSLAGLYLLHPGRESLDLLLVSLLTLVGLVAGQ